MNGMPVIVLYHPMYEVDFGRSAETGIALAVRRLRQFLEVGDWRSN